MKTDLHIHTKTGSDGNLSLEDVFAEAHKRNIDCLSITDHDSTECQSRAIDLGKEYQIRYITGVELNVTFQYFEKSFSLDFLGYNFNPENRNLHEKLQAMKTHREKRVNQILEKLNKVFEKEGIPKFNESDMKNIKDTADGTIGRPHIANYLIKKDIVKDKKEAFDKYLVTCDVPKYPLSIAEASHLIRNANGKLVLAHPDDPNGTSLRSITTDFEEQAKIIANHIIKFIDGIECWHSRHNKNATDFYINFAGSHNLLMTGGSDCHQKPIIMGSLNIPDFVCSQFR